jgi:hypothetical protein
MFSFWLPAVFFGRVYADVVKHRPFKRILKVTLFQTMLFVCDVTELLDPVVVDLSVIDCHAAVKPVSKQDADKDVPLAC